MKFEVTYLVRQKAIVDAPDARGAWSYCRRYYRAVQIESTTKRPTVEEVNGHGAVGPRPGAVVDAEYRTETAVP